MFFNLFKRTPSLFRSWEVWLIHLTTIVCGSIVAMSLIYYFYRLTPSVIGLVFCITFVIGWATAPKCKKHIKKEECLSFYSKMYLFGSFVSSLAIISVLWISRTEMAIVSPWETVPSTIFALYACSAFFVIRLARSTSTRHTLPALMAFNLATFGVSLIIYRLGFGYDPFVHQATERHIAEHGFIFPKQPMYIGQYVSVVALSWLSHLSIHRVDRALVPLTSVFVMIPMLVTAFRYGWMKKVGSPALAGIALCLIPIGYFAFTVPFNLALIALVIIIAFLPLADQPRIKWLIGVLGCASLAVHPLIGLPTAMIAMVAIARKIPAWSMIPAIPMALFTAFSIYLRTQGASMTLPTWEHAKIVCMSLFGNPYDLSLGQPHLAILYAFLYLAPLFLIGVAVYGYAEQSPEKSLRDSMRVLVYASIGIFISAVMIPMLFVFPNIIASEQFEFSLRLLLILPMLFLPGIVHVVHLVLNQKTNLRSFGVSIMLALVLTASWYVSYPQINDIAVSPAPGLSRGDMDAVQFIEANTKGMPYVALTSQMTSAGALMEFGFEKTIPTRSGNVYVYAIPTGGELYQYYLRFIMPDEEPQTVQMEFNQFVDAPLVYIAVPDSWDPEGNIAKRLDPIVVASYRVGGNRIFKLKAVAR
jgi:hypothetical protein